MAAPAGALTWTAGEKPLRSAESLAQAISSSRPDSALGLLRYSQSSGSPTFSLLAFNDKLRAACDATNPTRDTTSIFPVAPVFTNGETATLWRAGMQRIYAMCSAMLQRRLNQGSLFCLHVSRTGRLARTWKIIVLVEGTEDSCCYLFAQLRLPDNAPFTSDLQFAYGFGPILHDHTTQDSELRRLPSLTTDVATPTTTATRAQPRRRSKSNVELNSPPTEVAPQNRDSKSAYKWLCEDIPATRTSVRDNFKCSQCGAHETAQRRFALAAYSCNL